MSARLSAAMFFYAAVGALAMNASSARAATTAPGAPAAKPGTGLNYFQKLTGDDADTDKARWDKIYSKHKGYVFGKDPASFLVESLPLFPVGRALDIAMGEGRNAVYLAKKGFVVEGVDISEVAVRKAKRLAQDNGVRIRTVIADLNKYQIQPESYEVIMVFYFLSRPLIPQIKKGLKKGGIVVFENNTVDELKYDKTQNRAYLLERGELREMFKDLEILKYREIDNGKHVVASLVARKN
ncbi:MAG: methyltransferase domain-containing protein [Deltaproteobacteria bacterium]|nr:methyltransferase domain-containing protein [Deltaproteobacteria bacterium]